MRIIVFFDLPMDSAADRREYGRFRRKLIKNGFMMLQQSVYVKLALNQNSASSILENVRKIKPPKGLVQVLTVTEKQYQKIETLCAERKSDVLDSDERLIIL